MNDQVKRIRERLQDLDEQHITGFVNDAQYAEARRVLERRLAEAVAKEAASEAHTSAPVSKASSPRAAVAAKRPQAPTRWPLWVGVAALASGLAAAVYVGSTSHGPAFASGGGGTSQGAVSLQASAPSDPAAQPATAAAVIESTASVTPSPAPGDASISGTVTLSPELIQQAQATDTLFVYAHALDGPAVPLAVLRKQVKDLPLDFRLDDSMSMWSTAKLSSVSRVIITARISKSGDGKARKGDLQGNSAAVSAGSAGVRIEIGTLIDK